MIDNFKCEDVEECSYAAGGYIIWYTSLENNMSLCAKVKDTYVLYLSPYISRNISFTYIHTYVKYTIIITTVYL